VSSVTQVAKSAAKQIPTFVAILAALVLTATPWRLAGFALAVPALAGITWRAYTSGFGLTMAAQLMLVFGALAAYRIEISAPADLSLIIAGAAVAALVAFQPLLELLVGSQQIAVANLPGYSGRRRIPINPETLYAANIALVAVLAVCAAAGWSPWLVVLAAAVVAAGTLVVGEQAIGARLRGNKVSARFTSAIRRYEPAFAVYFTAPDETEYHVSMWLPYLERIGRPFVLIVREPRAFKALAPTTSAPVVFCPLVSDVDAVVTPSMRACFYVNNGAKNAHMVRFNQLTHIQMLHGDSDKASSFNPVTGMFDRIFVAGQAGIDRYAANGVPIPTEKFDIVGRPQVESVEVSLDHIRDVTAKTVLYASTWRGLYTDANYCSLGIGEDIVAELLRRKATVILRPHPYADRDPANARRIVRLVEMLADDRARTGREHLYGAAATRIPLIDCINRADALVSDVSGVASDWLQSGKPFALTDMVDAGAGEFGTSFPLSRAAYVIDSGASNLDAVFDNLLEDDPLEDIRRDMKAYYLGDFAGTGYADTFVRIARGYVDGPAIPADASPGGVRVNG
jgi:hypothetical protein